MLIKEHLDRLGWKGPVGLSCDDTKLLPALRPYLDSDGKYYIVGGVGRPMLLTDPDILTHAIRRGEVEKATKVSFFVSQQWYSLTPNCMMCLGTRLVCTSADAEHASYRGGRSWDYRQSIC